MKPIDPHAYAMIEDSGKQAVTLAEGAKVSLSAMIEKHRRDREHIVRFVSSVKADAARQVEAARVEAEAQVAAARNEATALISAGRAEAEALSSAARAEANRVAADAYAEKDRVTGEVRAASARLASELKQARSELAEVMLENDTLKKNHVVLMQNQRRLYLGFVSLLKSVEDACGAEIGVDQRIEATLLSSDIGSLLGETVDVSTAKARDFLSFTESPASRSYHTETPHA